MFDNVEIKVKAGRGGAGSISFNREKFHPLGGPDGGDGGRGADVYLQADKGVVDLSHFRQMREFKAEDGKPGGKQKKHGRDGKPLVLQVPVGTTISRVERGQCELMADLIRHGQKVMAAQGGKGGLGNVHFATATNQAPRRAGQGREGKKADLLLEFKSALDICILGLPNSGKSTLLARMTAAAPRIADYPFTTLEVIPGQLDVDGELISIAEIPALIQGSYEGRGLGNKFLRHCLRARVLLLVLDGTAEEIYRDLETLKRELACYSTVLELKPRIIAVNKEDLARVWQKRQEIEQKLGAAGDKLYFISAASGSGIAELKGALGKLLKTEEAAEQTPVQTETVLRPKPLARRQPK